MYRRRPLVEGFLVAGGAFLGPQRVQRLRNLCGRYGAFEGRLDHENVHRPQEAPAEKRRDCEQNKTDEGAFLRHDLPARRRLTTIASSFDGKPRAIPFYHTTLDHRHLREPRTAEEPGRRAGIVTGTFWRSGRL
jgi:hypothetical protein